MTRTTIPYGSWPSPISAAQVAAGSVRRAFPQVVGDEVWWVEGRPSEGGRMVVVAAPAAGFGPDLRADAPAVDNRTRPGEAATRATPAAPVAVRDVLPAPWSARTRVHEYGGLCFAAYDSGAGPALLFTEWSDQRLYRLAPGDPEPVPLTQEPAEPAGQRYADLVLDAAAARVLAVRESHQRGEISRAIVGIPLDGSAADEPGAIEVLAAGTDFLANPRLSPDRRHLAWIGWSHPNMPWDSASAFVSELDDTGSGLAGRPVIGGPEEAVSQLEWADATTLYAVSDRTGWWNLCRVSLDDAEPELLLRLDAESGAPLWQLGARTFVALDDARLAVLHGVGSLQLGLLDPSTGDLTDVASRYDTWTASLSTDGSTVVGVAASPVDFAAVLQVDARSGQVSVLSPPSSSAPSEDALPHGRAAVFPGPGGREVHAHVYEPRNAACSGPPGEAPPYVVFVHGGPTSFSPLVLDLEKAYFTSRGIGVLDVNHGGSTGYGRAYRERLRGAWGIVDVEDVVAAVAGLVGEGAADPTRVAIRGGSAGGWTTLSALTRTDTFACGTSLYGVADLAALARTTHDFESRYLDYLIGPAEDVELYAERSPLTRAEALAVPVLLIQGLDDEVVRPEQSERFAEVLRRKGIPHAYLTFAGEQHGLRQAANITAALEAELSFYGQVFGFDPPDVPRLELTETEEGS